jgi:hypothetical protein
MLRLMQTPNQAAAATQTETKETDACRKFGWHLAKTIGAGLAMFVFLTGAGLPWVPTILSWAGWEPGVGFTLSAVIAGIVCARWFLRLAFRGAQS